jgi:hypothetical protein
MAAEEEHTGRRKGHRVKALPLAAPSAVAAGLVSADPGEEERERSVAGAAVQGFAGGMLSGAQANLLERAAAREPAEREEKAPVRNAEGQSLADLTTRAPGEDPVPGTSQPLVVDALDAVQGIRPARPAQPARGAARAVVMHPEHIAGLKALEGREADGLESEGGQLGR